MLLRVVIHCPDCEEPLENAKGTNGEPEPIQQAYCSHCDTYFDIVEVAVTLANPLTETGQQFLDMQFGHG